MSLSRHYHHASLAEQARLHTAPGLAMRVTCCRPAVQQTSRLSDGVLRLQEHKGMYRFVLMEGAMGVTLCSAYV